MKHLPIFLVVCLSCSISFAQFQFEAGKKEESGPKSVYGPKLGASEPQTWLAGIVIEPGSEMYDVKISIPIPMDWPEQQVLKVNEEKTDAAIAGKIRYMTVNDGARQMVLNLGNMRPHRKVEVVVAVDLLNYELLPPDVTDVYVIPKRAPKGLEQYLKKSPTIECDNSLFLKMFNEITKDKGSDWDKVEAIYSYVQNNVKYSDVGKALNCKGALALISMPKGSWEGDCKDMCSLFVAICRAGKVPSRVVRLPEHCYAEFYLELKEPLESGDEKVPAVRGRKPAPQGFWFPCQVSGTYSFGGIPQRQPILGKGDSFPDPDKPPRGKKMFLTECFEGALAPGSPSPKFSWVHNVKGQ